MTEVQHDFIAATCDSNTCEANTSTPEIAECWISRGLSEKTRLKAEVELNESAEKLSSALEELRQLLNAYEKSHPDLVFSRRDDRFLRMFLRSGRYDVARSMKSLKRYLKFHAKYPELYDEVTVDSIRPALAVRFMLPLPERDSHGRRVIIMRFGDMQDCSIPAMDFQRAIVYVLDALLEDDDMQVNGTLILDDYGGVSMSDMMKDFDDQIVGQLCELFQDCYPVRFLGFHLFNQPWYYHIALSRTKTYLSGTSKKLFHQHGANLDGIFDIVPKESLPAEVGGDGPPYDLDSLMDFLGKVQLQRTLLPRSSAT